MTADVLTESEVKALLFEVPPANVVTLQRIADGLHALDTDQAGRSRCSRD